MTTIAYRDGIMAADSAVSCSAVYYGHVTKIVRADGGLLATAGASQDVEAVREWWLAGRPAKKKPAVEDRTCGLWVASDGAVWAFNDKLKLWKYDAPYYSEGSGCLIAIGAMAAGASAEMAVRIACRYDLHTREPVQVERLSPVVKLTPP